MKKHVFLLIAALFFFIQCMAYNMDFKLKINREFTMVFQKDKVELFPKKTEIILRCIEKNVKYMKMGFLLVIEKLQKKKKNR